MDAQTFIKPLHETERDAILLALEQHNGNKTRTAQALRIGIRTLQRKLHRYRAQGILVIPNKERTIKSDVNPTI